MTRLTMSAALLLTAAMLPVTAYAQEGNAAEPSIDDRPFDLAARQAPWGRWNIDLNDHDRVYSIGSSSGSISVMDPSSNEFLGAIRVDVSNAGGGTSQRAGSAIPAVSYAPNGRTLAVSLTGTRSVAFLDTRSNTVVGTSRFEGSPVGVTYAPHGKEVWIPVVGDDRISVREAKGFSEVARIDVGGPPGPVAFSNNGRYAFVCSASGTAVLDVAKRSVIATAPTGDSPCTSIAASPDGRQIWLTLPGAGRAVAVSTKHPFAILRSIDTGPRTIGVNFVSNDDGQFAYVSVAGLNAVKVFDTGSFEALATIPVGRSPSGVWPSGDGSRIYVGLEGDSSVAVIDPGAMRVVGNVEMGQPVQAIAYVPYAVRSVQSRVNLRAAPDAEQQVADNVAVAK